MKTLKYAFWKISVLAIFIIGFSQLAIAQSFGYSGYAAVDFRFFPKPGLYAGQHQYYLSFSLLPEMYLEWSEGDQSLQFSVFARLDQHDKERSHWDIREFFWQYVNNNWELNIGVRQIYWGVTESNHLVDIINQTDFVEGIDGEDKLGQPMAHFSLVSNWGTLDLFLLPYFRRRRFPSSEGRLWAPILLNPNDPLYESSAKNKRLDGAVRWSHTINRFDIGLSHFYGTNREPIFVPVSDNAMEPKFRPLYEIIHQTGLDLQITFDAILWKIEAIRRQSNSQTITALTLGGEYTLQNIFRSGMDVSLLGEYLYDNRGSKTPNGFNDDIFLGCRLVMNDIQSTQLLIGAIIDRKNHGQLFSFEGSRRIGDSWKAELEVRLLNNISENEFLYFIRKDTFVQFTIAKYF